MQKSAGAVVFRREKEETYYLLLHYQAGHWDFPKGHIEEGESLKQTVVREVAEETGIIDVVFIDGLKERIEYFLKVKGKAVFKVVIFFLAQTKTKEIKLSSEHTAFKWLLYEKALEQLTYKNAKEILRKAHNFL